MLPEQPQDDQNEDDDEDYMNQVACPRDPWKPRGTEVSEQPENEQDDDEELEHGAVLSRLNPVSRLSPDFDLRREEHHSTRTKGRLASSLPEFKKRGADPEVTRDVVVEGMQHRLRAERVRH